MADSTSSLPLDFAKVLHRFRGLRRVGRTWMARCPAHDDNRNSLSISADDGRLLIKCHAGCSFENVVMALGCEAKDFFNKDGSRMGDSKIVGTFDYRDEEGKLLFQVVRFSPKEFRQRHPDGKNWIWGMNGVRRVLYRLPDLEKHKERLVILVEGEKDADRLAALGFLATTNPMGAGKWLSEYSESLRDRVVVLIPDNDNAGREHARLVLNALEFVARDAFCLELQGLPEKGDVSDWLDLGHTADELKQLIKQCMETSAAPKANESEASLSSQVRQILDIARGLDRQSVIAALHGLLGELQIQSLDK